MASFFSTYPKSIINNRLVTDLTARVGIRNKYTDKLSIYYPYAIQEGDTPEIIAAKYYGDPERHWIVMLANDTINPFFDFTLDYQVFDKNINDKYAKEANSVNQWANCNWRGEWNADEYIEINGIKYSEKSELVSYSTDGKIEYIYDPETDTTFSVIEGGPDDIDLPNTYSVNDVVTVSNTAFICIKQHNASVFLDQLQNWDRIYDGIRWKDTWQENTDYQEGDVVKHNNTIYICTQDNLDNANNRITFSDAEYWKTYSNGLEYASVTTYGYRASITTFDSDTNESATDTFFIDKKAYNGTYNDPILNYASEVQQSGSITVTTSKERISIYQYEDELNENKREIKLIRKEYVPQLEQELKILMETYYG